MRTIFDIVQLDSAAEIRAKKYTFLQKYPERGMYSMLLFACKRRMRHCDGGAAVRIDAASVAPGLYFTPAYGKLLPA